MQISQTSSPMPNFDFLSSPSSTTFSTYPSALDSDTLTLPAAASEELQDYTLKPDSSLPIDSPFMPERQEENEQLHTQFAPSSFSSSSQPFTEADSIRQALTLQSQMPIASAAIPLLEQLQNMIAVSFLKSRLLPGSHLLLFAVAVRTDNPAQYPPHLLHAEKIAYDPQNIVPALQTQTSSSSNSSSNSSMPMKASESEFLENVFAKPASQTSSSSSSSSSSYKPLNTLDSRIAKDTYEEFEQISFVGKPDLIQKLLSVHCGKTKSLYLSLLPANLAAKLVEAAPSIKSLDLRGLPLSSQTIITNERQGSKRENIDLASLLKCFPYLESLAIYGGKIDDSMLWQFTKFSHLKSLHCTNAAHITPKGISIFAEIKGLQEVRLQGAVAFSTFTQKGMQLSEDAKKVINSLIDSLPHLDRFFIESQALKLVKPNDAQVQEMLTTPSETFTRKIKKEFLLRPCHHLTDATLLIIAKEFPNLESISLHGCFQFTEKGLNVIVALPKLKKLEMKNAVMISEDARKKVQDMYPGLSATF